MTLGATRRSSSPVNRLTGDPHETNVPVGFADWQSYNDIFTHDRNGPSAPVLIVEENDRPVRTLSPGG